VVFPDSRKEDLRLARVFISYRRRDSRWAAGRLYDRLAEVLGRENVFFDVSNIEPGEDFIAKISSIIATCDVLLVVIGEEWASARDSSGARRLEDPNDLIRVEIGAALKRNIRVIPILIDGAEIPREQDLPPELRTLVRRNAREVSFSRFHTDLDSFLLVLRKILSGVGEAAAPPPSRSEDRGASVLPFSVCIETLGGVASPLIKKGTSLPASVTEAFSTAEDNQESISVKLFLGERETTKDNVAVGTFQLSGIPPAKRGVPQIEIQTKVDPDLVLTVTATDLVTGRREVLDAVDLTQVEVPEETGEDEVPRASSSKRDSPVDLSAGKGEKGGWKLFEEMFGQGAGDAFRFGGGSRSLDRTVPLRLTREEAARGAERTIEVGAGRRVKVKVPPGMSTGKQLRLRGLGEKDGGEAGDLFLEVQVEMETG